MIVAISLGLMACDEIDGNLHIDEALHFNSMGEVLSIPAGTYETELDFKSKKKVELKININSKNQKVVIEFDREINFPKNNGEFSVPPEENNQNMYINGQVRTNVERSRRRYERETCEYDRIIRRCRTDRYGRRICRDYRQRVRGWRDVEYHLERTEKSIHIDLYQNHDYEGAGVFFAESTRSRRVNEYTGRCY